MSVPMQMKNEGARACVCVCIQCVCVSLWVPVCVFVFTKASHIPRFSILSRTTTHTQTGVRTGGTQSTGFWSMALLSKYYSLNFCLSLSPSLCHSVSVSLVCSLYSLFPTMPNTEGFFVIQSRKCNWSQNCPGFCLISSLLCSCRLPSPCAWPQTASVRHMGTSEA